MKDFERLKFLGKGAFATVWLVEHKTTHKLYAMKEIPKSHLQKDPEIFQHLRTEKEVLIRCQNCSFVVNLHYAFQSPHSFHLVLGLQKKKGIFHSHNSDELKQKKKRNRFN